MFKHAAESENSASLEKYFTDDGSRISTCFETCDFKPGQIFHARILQVYDPSKFWVVTKYRELEIFQKYMFRFYYMNGKDLKMSEEDIKMNLYCVTFIDNAYYRSLIVGMPSNLSPKPEVLVHFIDYGMVKTVQMHDIYYITKKIHTVPQFAIRASLAGIGPLKTMEWTSEDACEFGQLVINKLLVGIVVNIDKEQQVLEVYIADRSDVVPVHIKLIAQKTARFIHDKPEIVDHKMPYAPKLKYPYLFPSHQALESGKVPSKLCDAEYEVQFSSLSSVLGRYYKTVN